MHPTLQAFNPPGEPIDRALPPPFVTISGSRFTVHFIAKEAEESGYIREVCEGTEAH